MFCKFNFRNGLQDYHLKSCRNIICSPVWSNGICFPFSGASLWCTFCGLSLWSTCLLPFHSFCRFSFSLFVFLQRKQSREGKEGQGKKRKAKEGKRKRKKRRATKQDFWILSFLSVCFFFFQAPPWKKATTLRNKVSLQPCFVFGGAVWVPWKTQKKQKQSKEGLLWCGALGAPYHPKSSKNTHTPPK